MKQYSPEIEYERISAMVKGAATFEALYDVIRSIGVIPSSSKQDKTYTSAQVIEVAERMRHGHIKKGKPGERVFRFPPRAFGIREKVRELLTSDPVFLREQQRGRIPQGWEAVIPAEE